MSSIMNLCRRLSSTIIRIFLADLILAGGTIFAFYEMNQSQVYAAVLIMLIAIIGLQFCLVYPFLSYFSALTRAFSSFKDRTDLVPDIRLNSFAKTGDTTRLVDNFLDMAAHIRNHHEVLVY